MMAFIPHKIIMSARLSCTKTSDNWLQAAMLQWLHQHQWLFCVCSSMSMLVCLPVLCEHMKPLQQLHRALQHTMVLTGYMLLSSVWFYLSTHTCEALFLNADGRGAVENETRTWKTNQLNSRSQSGKRTQLCHPLQYLCQWLDAT